MKKGKLIILEGIDGSGKTTLKDNLKIYYKDNSKIIFTREPGGFNLKICEKIRELILDKKMTISPITESYLYAASRAEHIKWIKNRLKNGYTVISDRYYYSSLIYQGILRGIGVNHIYELNKLAISDLKPDLVIYLRIDYETFIKRKELRGTEDRIEKELANKMDKAIYAYDQLFTEDKYLPKNLRILNATKDEKEIFNEVTDILKSF